ncbi:alkaline phosphatase PhoX [Archangium violaceum]|uniref:Alkaline phosphatase n=1 Tax=Archangium violaceum Cb vi76 TaxID=1406225 RepID=A0A084SEJ0_9BACT|nr:alkaline phosphatase PhoX [Archangium violaceum]KFA86875.1 alkaline phosphatase [Archangium violaceum Cb vi76]
MRFNYSSRRHRTCRLLWAALSALALSACTGESGPKGDTGTPGTEGPQGPRGPAGTGKSLSFTPVNAARTDAEKRAVYASPKARVNGQEFSIQYETVLRSGQPVGEHIFGRMTQKNGSPVKNTDGSDFISPTNDFSALIKAGNRLFELTQFEISPAAMYLTELRQSPDGKLTALSTRPIDFSGVEGYWVPCAGSVSPWNTNLSSEEYPEDARVYEGVSSVGALTQKERSMLRYWGLDPATATLEQAKAVYSPYRYGYVVEVAVDGSGATTVTKHYAAGRRALELAYVMPDKKTVYLSDDGSNDGFYMFVATRPGDLSEGQLYAARWFQTTPSGAPSGRADMYWLPLGPSATNAQVKALIDGGIQFSHIFETEPQNSDGTCPSAAEGFRAINTETGRECLRLKPGQELAASRLESRRYAAYVGGTTEFRKTEGITYNVAAHRLYVAFSELNHGMVDDPAGKDLGGGNHVQVARNDCGAVYEMVVSPNATIGSEYVVESAAPLVEGVWLKAPGASLYPSNSPFYDPTFTVVDSAGVSKPAVANVCGVNGIANPDNLSFINGYDTLLIGEDTVDGHQNDMVWAYNVVTRELTRIFSAPYGSETTGIYFFPDINGYAYIKAQVQHPYGESDIEKLEGDVSQAQSYTGYIGPFPAMN